MPDASEASPGCYICGKPIVVEHKGANSDYGLCAQHLVSATLAQAWQAVDRAIRPLGYGGGASNSPWSQGYERAKNEALNAISALLDKSGVR